MYLTPGGCGTHLRVVDLRAAVHHHLQARRPGARSRLLVHDRKLQRELQRDEEGPLIGSQNVSVLMESLRRAGLETTSRKYGQV